MGSTAIAALAFPASALAHSNRIVINKSIDGARLGMTQSQVRKAVGKPAQVIAANKPYTGWNYGDVGQLEVDFDKVHGRKLVTSVTLEPDFGDARTSKGIRMNSTKTSVLHAYHSAKFLRNVGQIWINEAGTYNTGFLLSRSNGVIQISVNWNYG